MKLNVQKLDGKTGTMTVDDSVFGITPNESVVHQTVVAELTNSRQGTRETKNRALVRGGGKKPWKQKGRGVARAGTSRSPIWRGGGTVFGPQVQNFSQKVPKKVKQLARRSVLSQRAKEKELFIIESIEVPEAKTKAFSALLEGFGLSNKKLTILVAAVDEKMFLAARNIPNVYVVQATQASAYDMLDCELLVAEKAGLSMLNEQLMVKS